EPPGKRRLWAIVGVVVSLHEQLTNRLQRQWAEVFGGVVAVQVLQRPKGQLVVVDFVCLCPIGAAVVLFDVGPERLDKFVDRQIVAGGGGREQSPAVGFPLCKDAGILVTAGACSVSAK